MVSGETEKAHSPQYSWFGVIDERAERVESYTTSHALQVRPSMSAPDG